MKPISLIAIVLLNIPSLLRGEVQATNAPSSNYSSASQVGNGSAWQARILGWNSTEWQLSAVVTNALTGQLEEKRHRYIELADGLNYLDPQGRWQSSSELIELTPATGGAAALTGPLKVYFPPRLNPESKGITFVTSSNTVMHVKPIGLYYFDSQSGRSVRLASLRDTPGELLPPNQIVFRSAFSGLLCDMRYTYARGAFESDLLLLERPRPPEAYGLNGATTRLELWHEVQGPAPKVTPKVIESVSEPALRASMGEPDFIDETLEFGDVWFPQGRAFSWEGTRQADAALDNTAPARINLPRPGLNAKGVLVAKRWGQIGQKAGLCEAVRWLDVKAELDSLPPQQGNDSGTNGHRATLGRQLPSSPEIDSPSPAPKTMQVSRNGYSSKGFLLDFTILTGGSSYSFGSGDTVLVSSLASFNGTVEFGDCVIKFAEGAALYLTGPVICRGTEAAPSIFTSFNDFAFGEKFLPGATGYPSYAASEALWVGNLRDQLVLSGLKIRWAKTGILVDGSPQSAPTCTLAGCSLEWCETGVSANSCGIGFDGTKVCSLGATVTGAGNWSYTGTPIDVCTGDADQNGLPDSWEYKYFGRTGIDPLGDPDSDGVNNLAEFTLWLNPQVADAQAAQAQALAASASAIIERDILEGIQASHGALAVVAPPGTGGGSVTPLVVGCSNAPSGMVGWWRGEGDATDAIGGNDGKYCGTVLGYATGKVGQGFSMAGWNAWNYVGVANSPTLQQLTNAFTVEMWYKDTGSPSSGAGLIGKVKPGWFGFYIHLYPGNSLAVNFGDPGVGWGSLQLTPAPVTNTFHHLAATWQQVGSSIQVQVYIDGGLKTNGTYSGSLSRVMNNAPLMIGTDVPTSSFFTGIIDEVAIYSRVLSATEITNIYTAGALGKCVPSTSPSLSVQPTNQTVWAGSDVLLSAQGAGTGPLAYQWQVGGVKIAGATNRVFITNSVVVGTNSYAMVVTNSLGSVTSSVALLSVPSVPSCFTAPSNIVGWWRAESNAVDQVGGNDGFVLNSTGFVTGKVAQAFNFLGISYFSVVDIPSSPTLKLTNELTYEFWYKSPAPGTGLGAYGLVNKYPIPELCSGAIAANYASVVSGDDYYISLYLSDTNYGAQGITYWPLPTPGMFHHMAVTYHQSTSTTVQMILYVDGSPVQTNSVSGNLANALNDSPVTIGAWRPDGHASFIGPIDEVAIYSRALSASEVASIYNAGSAGKCVTTIAPSIVAQPTNQTVVAGGEAVLSALAAGTPTLKYQWKFNGTSISGATNKVYVINDVQPSAAGNYMVLVTNSAGSSLSQTGILSVASAPLCLSPASNLVSWWRAEGDATDCIGTNNGSLVNGVGYTSGKVNQGFSLGGSNYVQIPSSPSLRLTNAFTVELWYMDTGSSSTYGLISKAQMTSPYPGNFAIWATPNEILIAGFRDTTIGSWQYVMASPVPTVGMFHHVASVFQQVDASHVSINLYVDGQCAAYANYSGNLTNTLSDTTPVTIGSFGTTGSYFKGVIDEASIYSRALSLSEIQAIYSAGATGKCLTGDYDNDGLLDSWERQYFGNLSQMPGGDPDGDGLTNLQEYLLGTNPTNAAALDASGRIGLNVYTPLK